MKWKNFLNLLKEISTQYELKCVNKNNIEITIDQGITSSSQLSRNSQIPNSPQHDLLPPLNKVAIACFKFAYNSANLFASKEIQ